MMIKKLSWIKQFSGLPCFLILMTGYLLMQAGLIRTLQVGFIIIVFLWTEKLLREKKGSHLCEAVIFMFFFLWVIHNKLFTFFKEPYNAWIYTLFTIGPAVPPVLIGAPFILHLASLPEPGVMVGASSPSVIVLSALAVFFLVYAVYIILAYTSLKRNVLPA